MADSINKTISNAFRDFGLKIMRTLVTDISPDSRVLAAMNEINASKRNREATIQRAEAEKLCMIKQAEGEAETKYLMGVGLAKMREAITSGFKGSIEAMQDSCGLKASEVVHMMLVTQYMVGLFVFLRKLTFVSVLFVLF